MSDGALTLGLLDWLFDRFDAQEPRRKRRAHAADTGGDSLSTSGFDNSAIGAGDADPQDHAGSFDDAYSGGESGGGGASGDFGGGDAGGGDGDGGGGGD